MMQAAVYDLMVARPHEPDAAHFTIEQYRYYRQGYDHALVLALKVMDLADRRYKLRVRTLQLAARNEKRQA